MAVITEEARVPGAIAPAFLALPAVSRAALVVVHEIFGRAPEMERVCTRLADAGFAALMPDLFGDRFKPVCIQRALGEIARGRGPMIDTILAAADVVAARSGVARERVGVIGFCLGGGFALATGRAFRATSTNYGEVPSVEVLQGIGPTIGCYGTRDRAYGTTGALLTDRLQQVGVTPEVHTLDAGHAFLADGDHPLIGGLTRFMLDVNVDRDVAAREQGWQAITAFFERHLVG